ncbi:MAG: hypothetical protein OES34_12205 [Nitrosopumilus sp.]|nr:hypothetical protein [Nitrosopumilus sp.]
MNEIKHLTEELRKYQVLQYTPKELEIELNKYVILKNVILNELRLRDTHQEYDGDVDILLDKVEKILKPKEFSFEP